MYYVMQCLDPATGYLATLSYDFAIDEDPMRDWMAGERFEIAPPTPVEAIIEPRSDTVLAEMWQVPLPVMSRRLFDVLRTCGVSNLETFPARLVEKTSGKVHAEFVAFNVVGLVSATAVARAKPADDLVQGAEVNERVAGGASLFRLADSPNAIVVHAEIKRGVEQAGIDTLTFMALEDWTG